MYDQPLVVHEKSRKIYLLDWLDQDGELGQQLAEFSDLLQAPEEVHTFNISAFALWTAAAKGITPTDIIKNIENNGCHPIFDGFKEWIRRKIHEFGMLKIVPNDEETFLLVSNHVDTIEQIKGIPIISKKYI